MLLLKHFITKVLEYKTEKLIFVCVAMCSLVRVFVHMTSLNNILNSSRLTVVQLT